MSEERRHSCGALALPLAHDIVDGLKCGARRRLGADSSERDDMVGVYDKILAGFSLDEPCKLHD